MQRNDSPTAGPSGTGSSSRPMMERALSETMPVDIYAQFEGGEAGEGAEGDEGDAGGRVSMYVKIVNEMIDTVLSKETYLFSPHELAVIHQFRALSYEPKYLLVRLLLRKTNKIFSLSELSVKYSAEIGHHMDAAVDTLIKPLDFDATSGDTPYPHIPESSTKTGWTENFFTAAELHSLTKPGRSGTVTPEDASSGTALPAFRSIPASWKDVPSGLTPAEEKADPALAKALRISQWEVLKASADSSPASSRKGKEKAPSEPSEAEFYKMKEGSTEDIVAFARGGEEMEVEEMIRFLGMAELSVVAKELKCWKSKYNRGEVIDALLHSATKQSRLAFTPTPSKSKFKDATPTRQATLSFGSSAPPKTPLRQATLPFSTPLRSSILTGREILKSKIIHQLGGKAIQISLPFRLLISRINLVYYRSTITPSTGMAKSLMLPEILTTSNKRSYPSSISAQRSIIWPTRDALLEYERALEMEAIVDEALGEQNHSSGAWVGPSGFGFGVKGGRVEGARRVRKVWEGIWGRWKEAAGRENTGEERGARNVLDRFTLGHILTRVVSKGAVALGILHEYDQECAVLKSLLGQRVWRRGKRGAWYDRLALILMTHYQGDIEKKEEAVRVCIEALEDEDTHLIYRPRLSRRLARLEKQLDLPSNERHICQAELTKSSERTLKAHRVRNPAASAAKIGQKRKSSNEDPDDEDGTVGDRMMGKTWWQGREGEVGVEQWVLEWWEEKGYSGYHSESSILTTLFGLLFWPILYSPLPGAFETPYQLAPLDLGDDSFYQSRRGAIEERLERMGRTKEAIEMLREVDGRERERGTLAIGVRWEYGREELEEIISCMGGRSLSVICRMFCEEYGHRASGVPDLIVWHPKKKECRFVEVKSPNDTLSETQKVWISVLLSAGIEVEVCHVQEAGENSLSSNKKKRRLNVSKAPKKEHHYGNESEATDEEDGGGDEDEFKYESGGEGRKGRGEGRVVKRGQEGDSGAVEVVDQEEVDPQLSVGGRKGKGKRGKKRELKEERSGSFTILGDSAAQPIEL